MSDTTPAPQELTPEQRKGLSQAMQTYFFIPFGKKYEENFVEAEYWVAVEEFKAYAKSLGLEEDPIEIMKRQEYFTSYEEIRDDLMEGPPVFCRPGWVSELVGQTVDVKELVEKCDHLAGPKFLGEERVVVFDFWATW